MITRFAPSPTGPLHLGHAFSAILAHDLARAAGGTFLLRIEDIDRSRARPEWEDQIYDDLRWLGLSWDTPVMRQSERTASYGHLLNRLWDKGFLYPCRCNRRDILAALDAPQEQALPIGADGVIYPGTCRTSLDASGRPLSEAPRPQSAVLRLNVADASIEEGPLSFHETGRGPRGETGEIRFPPDEVATMAGDVVLARRDMGTSYHLSVVTDDAAQEITHVVRGEDLFDATRIHVLLQHLLGLPTPVYHHHRLIRDEAGRRLAKRDDARAIRTYREDGASPSDIRRMVGL